jgi:hypothetical protein
MVCPIKTLHELLIRTLRRLVRVQKLSIIPKIYRSLLVYQIERPPVTPKLTPVMFLARSDARKETASPISSDV